MHSVEHNGKHFYSGKDNVAVLQKNITEQVTMSEHDKCMATPKTLMLELTNSCNHSCVFCYHKYSDRKNAAMTLEFAKRIIDEAFEMGVRRLALYLLGEPFLYKYLIDVILYAKQKKYEYIYLTTNGALADANHVKKAIDAGLDSIKFSIDAVDEENYTVVHGRNDFNTVYSNIVWLYDCKVKNGLPIRVYVSSVLTKYNNDADAIYNLFKDKCDELIIVDLENPAGMMENLEDLLVDKSHSLKIHRRTLPCSMIFNRIHVTAEGLLTACCADFNNYLAYADLKEQDLASAWNNYIITALRNKHLCGDVKGTLCYNCINGIKSNIEPLASNLLA